MHWTLEATPESAAIARELVRKEMRKLGHDLEHTAVLLTDELVANAARHASGPLRLDIQVDGHSIRVAVSDMADTEWLTVDPAPDRAQTSGRGLFLVDSLSTRWGMVPNDSGKQVWFELDYCKGLA